MLELRPEGLIITKIKNTNEKNIPLYHPKYLRSMKETLMEIKKQLSIFMENQPGNLAKFCSILDEAKIDIQAISVTDAVDHAVIRIVASDANQCSHVLGDHGIVVIESEVLSMDIQDRPGELKKIAQILSQEKINIDYIYGSEGAGVEKAKLFFKVSDPQRALEMIKKNL